MPPLHCPKCRDLRAVIAEAAHAAPPPFRRTSFDAAAHTQPTRSTNRFDASGGCPHLRAHTHGHLCLLHQTAHAAGFLLPTPYSRLCTICYALLPYLLLLPTSYYLLPTVYYLPTYYLLKALGCSFCYVLLATGSRLPLLSEYVHHVAYRRGLLAAVVLSLVAPRALATPLHSRRRQTMSKIRTCAPPFQVQSNLNRPDATKPNHTTPHHATPHHTTPYHTTPHHTTPHHTTSSLLTTH